jgi:hypothetical protein
MMTIFFVWNASNDPEDVAAIGVRRLARTVVMIPLKTAVLGVAYGATQQTRSVIDSLHPNIASFPGVNGALLARHVNHAAKEWPSAKAGDAFRTTLAAIYAAEPNEHFNPNNY